MQAFLITAYKDKEQLLKLITKLCDMGKVFVHIDKKSKELSIEELKAYGFSRTFFFSKYKIYWGNFNHVNAILDLIKLSVEDKDIDYIHLISGQDYPIKNKEEFENTFLKSNKIYMSCSDDTIYGNEVRERYSYWYPITNGNPNNFIFKVINKVCLTIQKKAGYKTNAIGEFAKIYKGMIWASMPCDVAKFVLEYWNQNKSFRNKMKHIRLCEEFLFQTILMNSRYSGQIVRESLRYNDWEHAVGGSPAVIDKSSYDSIISSHDYFARKFETGQSDELMIKLETIRNNII